MVLVQNSPFFEVLFFGQYRPGKCLLRYSRTKKNAFLAYKKRRSKSRKIDIFPKGLTYGFGPRMASFSLFFRQYRPGKCLLRYNTTKNLLSKLQNPKLQKDPKIDIFPKGLTHGLNQKMAIFLTFFFLGNIGQENVCYDLLERKNDFLDYKDKKFKKSKNSHFFKGVNPSFWSKNGHFSNFFSLGNIGHQNVFYDILEGKNASLGYEKKEV